MKNKETKGRVVPLDFYFPWGHVVLGEGLLPTKGDVFGPEHQVKGVIQNYHGRTVVVLEALSK